jgi:ABC-type uncharacterized transport system substrate-binding protein
LPNLAHGPFQRGRADRIVLMHRKILSILIALAALFAAATVSWAHPHAFIVQRIEVVFDDKGLAGVKIRWKFDDMFASMIAEDYDRNRNGRLEPGEVEVVKENAFSNLSQFSYFTFIKINDKPFEVKYIKDFNAHLADNRLVYEFLIPCHVRATDRAKTIAVGTYDPTYYTAIFFAANAPVSLASAEAFDVKTSIKEDPDTTIYYDMVHPWTLFLEFRWKS